ncbi:glycoside hydrolase family 9 protein [Ningiella sp. W23]|uniref:glycoside hydrolase family 9 protein n=1 Tax=Ningiella sp. W23 TaxID=3023715 RepID=UPI0037577A1C
MKQHLINMAALLFLLSLSMQSFAGTVRLQENWGQRYLTASSKDAWSLVKVADDQPTWSSQQWQEENLGNGIYRYKNTWSGHYLTATAEGAGAEVKTAPLNAAWGSQKWRRQSAGNNQVRLQNVWTATYLNATADSNWADTIMANYRADWGSMRFTRSIVGDGGDDGGGDDGGNEGNPKDQSSTHNYGHALQLTPLFFAANQFGTLTDTRLPWRQNSYTDGDLSGGWGDAGDNILFGKAQFSAIAATCITAYFFEDELKELGQYDEIQKQAQHGIDFLLKAHERDSNGNTQSLVVQLSDSATDHPKWLTLEQTTHWRPVYRVDKNKHGSDYAALAAAAMGFCSKVLEGSYPNTLKNQSQKLLEFAKNNRGLGENNGVVTVYKNSNGDEDELALGALGVYLATGNTSHRNYANTIMDDSYLSMWAAGFEHQEQLVSTLLSIWGNYPDREREVKTYFDTWKNAGADLKRTSGGYVLHDSNNWGSSGSVAPALMTMSIYAKAKNNSSWDTHIKSQVDYLLGSNPVNMSYICGFNTNSNCTQIHHRGASGGANFDGVNKNMLWGALLGGVTENDYDFVDDHGNWTGNEPTVDYNSTIQAPLIYMYKKHGGKPLSNSALQSKLDSWNGFD